MTGAMTRTVSRVITAAGGRWPPAAAWAPAARPRTDAVITQVRRNRRGALALMGVLLGYLGWGWPAWGGVSRGPVRR